MIPPRRSSHYLDLTLLPLKWVMSTMMLEQLHMMMLTVILQVQSWPSIQLTTLLLEHTLSPMMSQMLQVMLLPRLSEQCMLMIPLRQSSHYLDLILLPLK